MKQVGVVGGGPAGMMAAYAAAAAGKSVRLFEKNKKLGKKLYITGKGRCNLTNSAPIQDFFDNVISNRNFLYSAFYTFGNTQLTDMLAGFGLPTKTERGGRVFPVSDKSSDVLKTLGKALDSAGVRISLGANVQDIVINDGRVAGIICDGGPLFFDSVIIATGGLSYPSTGSTGDGYAFAKNAGHTIVELCPSLVALDTEEDVSALAGLSLKNVRLSLMQDGKTVYSAQGEMLFTHTGISGPLGLTASAYMSGGRCGIVIDMKPALDATTLDQRLQRDMAEKRNKDFSNVLGGLIPQKLIPIVVLRTGISADKKAHSITRQERAALVKTLKSLEFMVMGKRPADEAVITRGGVNVKEIDASTMQSRLCPGLYFAGEVIDVDALTGGYNLQIAFSTGYLAGVSC
ncbi:MAG: NAD(P)/FAD-dependent oxidoreductase [Eubacteriales bacterium]|nr:NAD(P)/FAD-dependent oxidoreductase [Eubacteriales bacterium]